MLSRYLTFAIAPFGIVFSALAQQPAAQPTQEPTAAQAALGERPPGPRAPLFFREEWNTGTGGEKGVTQSQVANPNLELKLYGASGKEIQALGKAGDANNPPHVWNGLCTSPCALAFRDKTNYVDLTGLAKVRWLTKISGFHKVHPIVKLADGTWLVGDHADGSTVDWHDSDFSISEVRWLKLDADKMVTKGNWVEHPDLSKVDEFGFTDLLPGSGHGPGGWYDVAWVELYGKPVKRDAATN